MEGGLPNYKQMPSAAWASPSPTPAPTWQVESTKEEADIIERFMQFQPTASLDPAKLLTFQQLLFVRTNMFILGQELNAVEPLSKGGTFESIFAALSSGAAEPEGMAQAFHVEGGVDGKPQSVAEWKKMVWQCVRALRRLLDEDELTVEGLIEVHKIMMQGAYGAGAEAGEGFTTDLRSEPAFAGRFAFSAPKDIPSECEHMVAKFNRKRAAGETNPVQLATDLMYDFVTIHPFSNGNGRMCRMVFTYALFRCGFPFPVMYSSHHSGHKGLKDYLDGIILAQTSVKRSARFPMYSIAFYAVCATIRNAQTYFKGINSDEWTVEEVPSPRSAVV